MQAFINQMANTRVNGALAVRAKIISCWQGFAEMSRTLVISLEVTSPIVLVENRSLHPSKNIQAISAHSHIDIFQAGHDQRDCGPNLGLVAEIMVHNWQD